MAKPTLFLFAAYTIYGVIESGPKPLLQHLCSLAKLAGFSINIFKVMILDEPKYEGFFLNL